MADASAVRPHALHPSALATLLTAAGLGAIAGLRTMAAPAAVSRRLTAIRKDRAPQSAMPVPEAPREIAPPAAQLANARVAAVLSVLAAGELVGDKLPMTPARTDPLPIAGRLLSGALVGAAVCASAGRARAPGAVLGMAAAYGAAHAMFRVRRTAGRALHLPDPLLGAVEDLLVVASARALSGQLSTRTPDEPDCRAGAASWPTGDYRAGQAARVSPV